jgi:glutamate-1-semialdehyde 2,1-aminomutase
MTKLGNAGHFERARQVMPGGVSSSTRVNKALGHPLYIESACGSHVRDIEGRNLIDMCAGHGAALLGHAHPAIDEALRRAMRLGYGCAFETPHHEELARRVCEVVPCAERVRFCSAGSEATLHLIRACRAFTKRKKILRVEGHFHGYHELIYIGGQPPQDYWPRNRVHPYLESEGIPEEFARLIIPVPCNDANALREAIARHGEETALMILEPVNFNWAGIKADIGYLQLARELTRDAGIVLFFDEIQSSFKKSPGGAQEDFGVIPDVCTIGKALGGGLPLSAFCGRADIMDMYKPFGPVQHSGTFNATLIPVLAGLAFLGEIAKPDFYPRLRAIEQRLHAGLDRIIADNDLEAVFPHHGARFNVLLGRRTPALRYEDAFCHDNAKWLEVIRRCFELGVYFHDYGGGPIHHGYTIQHSDADIDEVLNILDGILPSVLKGA